MEDYQIYYDATVVYDDMCPISQLVDAERQVFVSRRLKMRPFGRGVVKRVTTHSKPVKDETECMIKLLEAKWLWRNDSFRRNLWQQRQNCA